MGKVEQAFAKQLTAAGFQLKGSGWYVTDFRDGGAAAKADKTDEKAAETVTVYRSRVGGFRDGKWQGAHAVTPSLPACMSQKKALPRAISAVLSRT